jgi:glycosyltransferase involved in cell wall biosynthesis
MNYPRGDHRPHLRLLCLAAGPIESPSTRYRLSQYFPLLAENGIECHLSPFLDSEQYDLFYRPGRLLEKIPRLFSSCLRRLRDLLQSRHYDAILVSREAIPFGPPWIEELIPLLSRRPLLFDFDDATWISYRSPTYGALGQLLKFPGKTARLIQASQHVFAGNSTLAQYASQFHPRVTLLPTTVNPDRFAPPPRPLAPPFTIGWVGSHSTSQYLRLITNAIMDASQEIDVELKIVGSTNKIEGFAKVGPKQLKIEYQDWKLENEVSDFQQLDLGLYPLVDNEWTRGKCGFKAIQYLAAGVPCVASPVGTNLEIIEDGRNGLLAESPEEWRSAILRLLTDRPFRDRVIAEGYRTVQERYSLEVHGPRLAAAIRGTCEGWGRGRGVETKRL